MDFSFQKDYQQSNISCATQQTSSKQLSQKSNQYTQNQASPSGLPLSPLQFHSQMEGEGPFMEMGCNLVDGLDDQFRQSAYLNSQGYYSSSHYHQYSQEDEEKFFNDLITDKNDTNNHFKNLFHDEDILTQDKNHHFSNEQSLLMYTSNSKFKHPSPIKSRRSGNSQQLRSPSKNKANNNPSDELSQNITQDRELLQNELESHFCKEEQLPLSQTPPMTLISNIKIDHKFEPKIFKSQGQEAAVDQDQQLQYSNNFKIKCQDRYGDYSKESMEEIKNNSINPPNADTLQEDYFAQPSTKDFFPSSECNTLKPPLLQKQKSSSSSLKNKQKISSENLRNKSNSNGINENLKMEEKNEQLNDETQIKEEEDFIPEKKNFNFYHEFCRLNTANIVLTSQLKDLVHHRAESFAKFSKLEKKSEELWEEERKKRFRRVASQIDRHFKCPSTSCSKSYGSEGSLSQHLKIKHPELYQGGAPNSAIDSEFTSVWNGSLETVNDVILEERYQNKDEESSQEHEKKADRRHKSERDDE